MSIGSVNSPLSLQESQLVQILSQQAAFRAKVQGSAADNDKDPTGTGQKLPGGKDVLGYDRSNNLDPELSPEKISALLLALQTQQASLDTTLLLSGASSGSGGNTLADYLTGNTNVANPYIDDGMDGEADKDTDAPRELSLVDYLS